MTHNHTLIFTLSRRAEGVSPLSQRGVPIPIFSARRAFTLWELAAVLVGLQVFLALSVGILWAAIGIEQSSAEDFQHTVSQGALADQFRADVAAADSAPNRLDTATAGPTCLILLRRDGPYVIYRWDGERLERTRKAGAATSKQPLSLGAARVAVEFTRSGRLLTLRLTETHGQGSTRRTQRIDIMAALGGDLQ